MQNIPVLIFIIAIVILVVAYIAQPMVTLRLRPGKQNRDWVSLATVLRSHADLLARRNQVYRAIVDLDFDYRTQKVSDDDYTRQRVSLMAHGVQILQEIDSLPISDPDSDPLETAIRQRRSSRGQAARRRT